jgi:transcriptional regulator
MGVLNALTKNENLKEMTDLMEKNISIYKKNMFK